MYSPSKHVARWLWRSAWLVGGVAAMWLLAWLVVPLLVKAQIEKAAGAQLGRSVTVGRVEFRPWTLELTLHDLAIAGVAGAPPQLAVKRIYLNVELESVLRLAPVVEDLVIESPQARLTYLGQGKYDIDDVLQRLARPTVEESGEAMRFALFNVSLQGGAMDFDDRSVGKVHALRELRLSIPFLSNLASRREVTVQPSLAFNFNGSRFDSAAQSVPFAPSRKTDATMRLRDFDLAPYLPYIPSSLPVRLQQARLSADIRLAFEYAGKPVVRLQGPLELVGVKLADASARELLAFDRLQLMLEDVRPLEQSAKLGSVALDAPRLSVRREASGLLNLDLAGPPGLPAPATPATGASAPAATAAKADWKLEVGKFALAQGIVTWSDAAVAPQAELTARELTLEADGIAWPFVQPANFRGSATLSGTGIAAAARVGWSGAATDTQAKVQARLDSLPLDMAAPYMARFLEPTLRGSLSADFSLQWTQPDLQVSIASLALADLALVGQAGPTGKGATELATIKRAALSQAQLDLAKQQVVLGKVQLDQPSLRVARGQDGRWMFERWLKVAASPAPAIPVASSRAVKASRKSSAVAPAPATGWEFLLQDLALEGGRVQFDDLATPRPVAFELSALKLQMKNVRPDGNQPSPVQLSARIRAGGAEPGQLDYRGSVQAKPMVAQGAVVASRIPVHAFEPYFGGGLNIELLRADAGFKGDMRYAALPGGPSIRISGDSVLEEFRANSLAPAGVGLQAAEELLTWKTLGLRGLELTMAPGSATSVAVKETTLSDFFARVIVHENGRINLQDLVKSGAEEASAPPAEAAPASGAPMPVVAAGPASVAQRGTPEPVINVGPVSMINGKVFFSDRFVKPNYSANLSALTGKLSAFSSVAPQGQPQLADLELRGRAEGTASLEIVGKLNPLATPLALDVKGTVRDLELPPLSPYSVKYAGYGIERGKLSVDVAYQVLPDGQLTASNNIVLNQLTFGDKVEGAPNSLPVKLAVALLADRNGVIDINLPVSGSLNDPQFRLGPIIVKVIVNLIVKAVTAPFSLLASAFGGGGDELSTVAFVPGSAQLQPDARQGLDKVAKALAERPALRMTVVGTASLEAEREAYRRERLRLLLVAEKRRQLVTGGSSAGTQEAAALLDVSDEETPILLKQVYQRADMPKPRNLVGVATDIGRVEMEALLLAHIPVDEDAMRELALQRGIAVKDYLGMRQLPVERLFLGAVKPSVSDPAWSPRAELSLTNN